MRVSWHTITLYGVPTGIGARPNDRGSSAGDQSGDGLGDLWRQGGSGKHRLPPCLRTHHPGDAHRHRARRGRPGRGGAPRSVRHVINEPYAVSRCRVLQRRKDTGPDGKTSCFEHLYLDVANRLLVVQ